MFDKGGKEIRRIGISGAHECTSKDYDTALNVGRIIALRGGMVVCGGLGGIMEAVARGAREEGGPVMGIIPGTDATKANPYIDIPVVTGMGHARNMIIVWTSEVLIALPGGYGTLSEISLALKAGRPVISMGSWEISHEIIPVKDPEEAVEEAFRAIG